LAAIAETQKAQAAFAELVGIIQAPQQSALQARPYTDHML
jgi:hypothetical protein